VEFGLSTVQPLVQVGRLDPRISDLQIARLGGAPVGLDGHTCSPACGGCGAKKGDEALGRSRGGFTTKLHIACDAHGKPVQLLLGPGQEHDLTRADELLADHQPAAVIADKAYDADAFLARIREREAEIVIPPLKVRNVQRPYNRRKYKQRNLIERFVNRLKHYRRVATRYEKTARNFLAFACLTSTLVTLGANVNTT
jgi:transposase